MRCGTSVSGPVDNCCASLTAHHSRYIAVRLLTGQTLYFVVKTKSRAREVYAETCCYLAGQGMADTELFGLAIASDGEYLFLDPESKLSKYAPKNWKSSSSGGLDCHGAPILVLELRVQFYVESPRLLRDETSRHHYYLQLRENVLARGQVSVYSSDELALLLAGYALQADLGDFDETKHERDYFVPERYLPRDLVPRSSNARATATALHKENAGMTNAQAETQYIKEASSTELCPLSHNLHLYRLKSQKQQKQQNTSIWMAVCARGIHIYEETLHHRAITASYPWNTIGNLSFDRKKFEIRSQNDRLTFYTSSDEKSKHLLLLCRLTHQFSLTIQSRLSEARKREEEEKKRYREYHMYGRGMTSEFPDLAKLSVSGGYKPEQRTSVISNASSNTTSGIVSDRVQSLDGSEDDLEIELLGKVRPPGDSVESLALAHLCDGSNEDVSPRPKSAVSGEDVTDGPTPTTSCTPNATKSSPSSGGGTGAATPATTDGSQCSSSCSTVVVAGPSSTTTSLAARRASTTSSLELGYSHTAQNSFLSELDLESLPKLDIEDTESKNDLESGVYTNSTRDTTQQTDNSSSGVYTLEEPESELGMRERSGSNVSFHGDGSDPSEAGKGALLTPEELSDLIVGSYPCRATVSHTLDSDSDYVTLPPPPRPPPRSEASARFVTTKPHISMTCHSSVTASGPNYVSLPPPSEPPPPPIPQRTYQFDPGAKMKPMSQASQGVAVVGKNNYLDVHASRVRSLLGYRGYQQRPPPPPVPPLATVYTSQVTRSQIEQYKQQLYSDVDYVIYPMKDPAISKQEYMDAKLAALASGYAYPPPPPPYRSPKTHVVYRSAPNVAYLPVNFSGQPEHLYGYCTYLPQPSHYSSTSPLYSTASYSSSSSSLRYEPSQLVPHPLSHIPGNSLSFSRTRSDENLLNDLENPRYRRLPPPPPPPPYDMRQSSQFSAESCITPPLPRPQKPTEPSPASLKPPKTTTDDKGNIVDINALLEKSKNLDLPLISALCNDKSLIRQTNAFVMPKHPNGNSIGSGSERHRSVAVAGSVSERRNALLIADTDAGTSKSMKTSTLLESLFASKSHKRYASSSKLKYPVSGLSTTQISKQHRKMSSAHVTHVHPRDVPAPRSKTHSAIPSKETIVP